MVIKNKPEPKLCECGCDEYAKPGNRFITGHNRRNIKLSAEICKMMRKSAIKRYEDPLEHEKAKKGQLKRYEDPLEHEKQREFTIKRYEDPLEHEKNRKSAIKRYEDPLEREKAKELAIKRWKNPLEREKLISAQIKGWENPERRENAKEVQLKRWEEPLEREKILEGQNKYWDDPITHERQSASHQGQSYPDEWTGFADGNRPHLIPASQCLHLNPWFKGCVRHHIMAGVIIHIPDDLHRSVWHRMTNGDRN